MKILNFLICLFRYKSIVWGNVSIHPSAVVRFCLIRGAITVGERCRLYRADIYGNIRLGKMVSLTGPRLYLHSDNESIEISDFTSIAPGVLIITSGHSLDTKSTSFQSDGVKVENSIKIGSHCWIACGAIVLGGCKLKDHTVIAAGGVAVGKEYESNIIAAGVPVRKVKSYDNEPR